MDLYDVDAAEKAEASIYAFINSRSKAKEKANAEEEAWKESTQRYNEKRRRRTFQECLAYHDHMLKGHEKTLGSLVAYHRGRRNHYAAILGIAVAEELLDGIATEGGGG